MTTLKRNISANLLGGAWIAALFVVITPLQVNLLGLAAYGFVGLITTLQIIASVLDMGLSSTITRELAADHSEGRKDSRPLLRTALTYYWALALVIGVATLLGADAIGKAWFTTSMGEGIDVARGLQVIALILALRLPVALYAGALAGIQRMDILNVIKAAVVTVRMAGGIVVLLVLPRLDAFLLWTVVSAMAEIVVYVVACRLAIPTVDWRPGFSLPALKSVWGFSLSVNGLALLALFVTQLDRVVISKLLPLEQLGYYSLALSAASAASLLLASLSSALMPSFAAAHSSNSHKTLVERYDSAVRLTMFLSGAMLMALLFFGEPLLAVWVSSESAEGAWQSLALVAAGYWLAAAVTHAYNIAIASRQAGQMLLLSAATTAIYIPVLLLAIPRFGIEGAAFASLLLNAGYVLLIVPAVHGRILHIATLAWFRDTLLPFALLGAVTFGSARLAADWLLPPSHILDLAAMVVGGVAYLAGGYFLLSPFIRADVTNWLRNARKALVRT